MNRDEAIADLVTRWGYSKGNAEHLYDSIIPKPVVPQYVADWYEGNKGDLNGALFTMVRLWGEKSRNSDFYRWFRKNKEAFQILVNMHQFGYEVEKEKLYTVEIPNPNVDSNRYGLCKLDGRIIIGSFEFGLNKATNAKLTEAEIKEDFEWAWQFAKEVE